MQGETSPIMTVDGIELPKTERDMHPAHVAHLNMDRQIFLLPVADAIVSIPTPGDAIYIHRFQLDEELKKSEVDYLFAASVPPAAVKTGTTFQYQVEGKSKRGGIKYRLESGPTGMAISPTGMVTWKAARSSEGEEVVIVALSDASGQETFHTFKVRVDSLGAPATGSSATASTTSTPLPKASGTGASSTTTTTAVKPVPTPSGSVPNVAAVGTPLRKWKSRDGMFTIEAHYAGSSGGKVSLLRPTGDRLDVALDQLSQEDNDYVAKQPK